jgi:hypothetical protein
VSGLRRAGQDQRQLALIARDRRLWALLDRVAFLMWRLYDTAQNPVPSAYVSQVDVTSIGEP